MKRALVMLLAVPLLGVVPVTQGQEKDKKTTGAPKKIIVFAKKTAKLSARLVAIKISGGKAVGKVKGNGVVIEVASAAAAKDLLQKAGARVQGKAPEGQKEKSVDNLILIYKKAPSAADLKKMGLQLVDRHSYAGGEVLKVKPTKALNAALVTRLEKEAGLQHAEINKEYTIPLPALKKLQIKPLKGKLTPNDPKFNKLWGMHNIKAPTAWFKGAHAKEVIVAVIDTGVDLNHEDLKAHLVPGINGIDPKKSPQDDQGHGTHCAGTIGAVGNNMKGVAGVCWTVKIMPCKFLPAVGGGDVLHAVRCIDFAIKNKARIMSNSWGGGSYSQALYDAIGRAAKVNILFVAAGNGASDPRFADNDKVPHYPSSYNQPNVLAVAAIDVNNKKADFSQFGLKSVHIGAPGVNIFSTMLKTGGAIKDSSGYGAISGTSMATPHVSGAAALCLGRKKYATYKATELKSLILKNARKIAALNGKVSTGGTLDIGFLGN